MIELSAEESLRIEQGHAIEVTCLSGVVWVTQEKDLRDLFLAPGESMLLKRRGLALVTALEPAAVHILDVDGVAVALQSSACSWFGRTVSALRALSHRWHLGVVTKIRAPIPG